MRDLPHPMLVGCKHQQKNNEELMLATGKLKADFGLRTHSAPLKSALWLFLRLSHSLASLASTCRGRGDLARRSACPAVPVLSKGHTGLSPHLDNRALS
jgi:hypothetical protein